MNKRTDEKIEEFTLLDYDSLKFQWLVKVCGDSIQSIHKADPAANSTPNGMLYVPSKPRGAAFGFYSCATNPKHPGSPGYSEDLRLLVDNHALGDTLSTPSISLKAMSFSKVFHARGSDGWSYHLQYTRPWIRELLRKIAFGSVMENDPVDFFERLMSVVSINRPQWIEPT